MRTTLLLVLVAACGTDPTTASVDDPVTIDTSSAAARAQYDADVAFALHYTPSCTTPQHDRPRVLVSGFGRFRSVTNNASGRIVAKLGNIDYPESTAPNGGQIDRPGPQLSVGTRTITLPDSGQVDLCTMVLPVVWDLAPSLLLQEIDAFQPDLVIMNGVSDDTQPLWIELGAINKAVDVDDATGVLEPSDNSILDGAPMTHANLMSWDIIRTAARRSRAATMADDSRFGDILTGVVEQAPRTSNSYLCNNITYVTSYLMDQPAGTVVPLLVASDPISGRPNKVPTQLSQSYRHTPRVFFHWPTELTYAGGIAGGVDLLRDVIDAQLRTNTDPTRGSW